MCVVCLLAGGELGWGDESPLAIAASSGHALEVSAPETGCVSLPVPRHLPHARAGLLSVAAALSAVFKKSCTNGLPTN